MYMFALMRVPVNFGETKNLSPFPMQPLSRYTMSSRSEVIASLTTDGRGQVLDTVQLRYIYIKFRYRFKAIDSAMFVLLEKGINSRRSSY